MLEIYTLWVVKTPVDQCNVILRNIQLCCSSATSVFRVAAGGEAACIPINQIIPWAFLFDPLFASHGKPTRVLGAYTTGAFCQYYSIGKTTSQTSKPLRRLVKASFNLLFADRTFSTTVTIKARCSRRFHLLQAVWMRHSQACSEALRFVM